jgi:flagellar basal-body rod modification protein FlgD
MAGRPTPGRMRVARDGRLRPNSHRNPAAHWSKVKKPSKSMPSPWVRFSPLLPLHCVFTPLPEPMQITSTNPGLSAATVSATTTTAAATPASNAQVTTQDFMQLLSTEMSNQDPMQPMDPSQTMTQLAQFTSLQQATQMAQTQGLATANSMLGNQVTVPGSNGSAPVTGTVTAVDATPVASGGLPLLVINGVATEVPITSVTAIAQGISAANAASASSAATPAAASTGTTTTASTPTSTSPVVTAIQAISQLIQ